MKRVISNSSCGRRRQVVKTGTRGGRKVSVTEHQHYDGGEWRHNTPALRGYTAFPVVESISSHP